MYFVLDIGGTNIKSAYIDKNGKIIKQFDSEKTPQNMPDLYKKMDELIFEATKNTAIEAIPLSCAGINDEETREILHCGSMPFLDGNNLPQHIEDIHHLPSSIINDGQAATLGEKWIGELQGIKHGALITLGTGVGCGLIINNEIYYGANKFSGELSFIYTDNQTPSMANKASSVNFFREAATLLGQTKNIEDVEGKDIFNEIKRGNNKKLNNLFIQYSETVGRLIYNVQMVLDYELVAIGGGISAEPLFIEEVRRQYQFVCDRYMSKLDAFRPVQIRACKLHNNANLVGAVYHYLKIKNKN